MPTSRLTGSRPSATCRSRQVMALVSTYTHGRGLGFSGEPGVNVLQLNLALDRLAKGH